MKAMKNKYIILQKDEWKNVAFDGGFITSYQFIDSSILLLQGQGYSNLEAEKQAVLFGNNILEDHLAPGQKYVMIQDWSGYENSSSKARQFFIDSIVKDPRIKGLIFCNTTWTQAITIKLAKTLKIINMTLHICDSIEDSILCGKKILRSEFVSNKPKNSVWSRLFSFRQMRKQNHKKYIQDLIDYLETIDWKTGKPILNYTVDSKHPMLPVFDAISFIKSQLDKTFEDHNRVESALIQHKKDLETTVRQRTYALEQSEKHFKQLIKHSPISSVVIENNYNITFVNKKFTDTFGYSLDDISTPEQIVSLISWAPENKSFKFQRWVDAILKSNGIQFGPHEQRILCHDGSIRTTEITSTEIGGKILVLMNDITKRKHAESKLAELAIRDDLTSLFNRRHFMSVLESEFNRHKRYTNPLSIMLIDVDHFKRINDTHGHPGGDMVLKKLSNTMCRSFRDIDTIFRIGGEEFAIILPETEENDAMIAAKRLKNSVETMDIEIESSTLSITVSIGLSTLSEENSTMEAFIKKADDALYLAKNKGRNRIDYL